MKTNIPTYRGKMINSDEYVEGWLVSDTIIIQEFSPKYTMECHDGLYFYINPSTLAINFPDMLDGDNNKIFASLSEDGRGGDILRYVNKFNVEHIRTLQFTNLKLLMVNENSRTQIFKTEELNKEEVIGMQND